MRELQRVDDHFPRVRARVERRRDARRCIVSPSFGEHHSRLDGARIVCRQDDRRSIADRADSQQ